MKNNQKTSFKEFIICLLILIPIVFFDKHPALKWLAILIIVSAVIYMAYLLLGMKKTEQEVISSLNKHEHIKDDVFEEAHQEVKDSTLLSKQEKKKVLKEVETLKEKTEIHRTSGST